MNPVSSSIKQGATAALAVLVLAGTAPQGALADSRPRTEASGLAGASSLEARWRMPRCAFASGAGVFVRTELFFGLSRPGGIVSEEEFKTFVDQRVTPRFPDGLTVLSGSGQFREPGGTIIVEGSKLLILLHPAQDREANRKIEQIRSDYKVRFDQQSVLRADDLSCVSF